MNEKIGRDGGVIREETIVRLAYLWLAVPSLLFVAFWLKVWLAVPIALLLAWAVGRVVRPGARLCGRGFRNVRNNWRLWLILLLMAGYVIYAGIGGFSYQIFWDHAHRNAVEFDLVRRDWPVTYPDIGNGQGPRMLCYYFGYWLPSALISKLCGGYIMIADMVTYLYSFMGAAIILLMLFSMFGGKARMRILLVFILFSPWNFQCRGFVFWLGQHFEFFRYVYDCMLETFVTVNSTEIFFFAYNQGIAFWIGGLLLWHERYRVGRLALVFSLTFALAPIPCVPIAAALLAWVTAKGWWRRVWTLENIAGLAVGIVTALFFAGSKQVGDVHMHLNEGGVPALLCAGLICSVLMYLPYFPFVWRYVRRDTLFWFLYACYCLGPFLFFGYEPDFGWRVGLPFQLLITVKAIKVATEFRKLRATRAALFTLAVAIGTGFPFVRYVCVYEGIETTLEKQARGEEASMKQGFMMGKLDDPYLGHCYTNFIASRDSFFARYLMRSE